MYCNSKEYEIKYTDVDFNDNIKLSFLLSVMEESACYSADELGFGYSVLQPKNIGFVIVNWHIQFFRPVRLGEKLTVHTWPIKPQKIIVMRDFEFFVGEEKVGVATSRWGLVNLSDFSVLPTTMVFRPDSVYNEERSVAVTNWKIPRIQSETCTYSKVISYSDYDHYYHVNNTKYADLLMDAFSVDELEGKFFKNVNVSYIKQTKFAEKLDVYRSFTGEKWLIEGRVDGELRVQMSVEF